MKLSTVFFSLFSLNLYSSTSSRSYRRSTPLDENDILVRFLRYDEIYEFVSNIAREYREFCSISTIGTTYEGRPIPMLKMSTDFDAGKPLVVVEGGLHAREWISPSLAMYIILRLVSTDVDLLDKYDWHIIPCANPDGYEYSHTKDRLWRKNRSPNSGSSCPGKDLNRNFASHWSEYGSSSNPCHQDYHGVKPFTEPEARGLRDHVKSERNRMHAYLSLHSFGNIILYPWGYTSKTRPADWKKSAQCAYIAKDEIENFSGTNYSVGNADSILYPASGASDDYMKARFKVPYVYTVELTSESPRQFILPPEEIREVVEEAFEGIRVLATCP